MFHCLSCLFYNKPSSALHTINFQAINKATAARSALENIISSFANIIHCLNFLSILDLPINLNFGRARFEFDISWLTMFLFFKTLNFLFLFSLLFCKQKRINVQKNESARAGKAFCYCLNFLRTLDLPINLKFVREQFEFDIS